MPVWNTVGAILLILFCGCRPAPAAEYKIGPQDRLQIRVHEWPALNAQLSVSPEGGFTLPLIGFVRAAGMSVGELERHVSDRLQAYAKLGESPFTSVEVLQFRPFYVAGEVARPGDYPFRPGLTVMMAISIAGGLYRNPDAPVLRLGRDAVQSGGRIAAAESRLCELGVTRARLVSELARGDDFRHDPADGSPSCKAALDAQRQVLRSRRQGLTSELDGYRERIAIYHDQIKLLRLQIESAARQRASVDKEIAGQQALSERGLALSSRLPSLERLASQIEGDQRGLETAIARARDNIAATEAAAAKVESDRRTDILTSLAQVETWMAETAIEITTNRNLYSEATETATKLDQLLMDRRGGTVTIMLARRGPAGTSTLTVTELDEIAPGDVVIVQRIRGTQEPGRTYSERPQGASEQAALVRTDNR